MSWKEHDRLVRELGIKELTPDRLLRLGVFGTTLIPGGFGGAARRGKADDRTPPAERGEDPETCPFTTTHSEFGEGNLVVIPPSLLGDLLARRFGRDSKLDDIAHLLYDRRNYTADELNEGRFGLVTTPPFSQGVPHPTASRTSPVSIRRVRKGRIVISQREHASDPIKASAGTSGCMRIHRANPMRDRTDLFERDCTCLATVPFTRWMVEGSDAARFEEALRCTDELVEFGVYGSGSKLLHSTWLIGHARGRGAALWPTAQNATSTRPADGTSICVGDEGIADEIRRELVQLNEDYGVPVPGKHHGDLDAVSAWHMLLKRPRP